MLFLLNGDGTMQRLDSDRIFQGSNNFTELGVIFPYAGVTLSAGFTLPNGMELKLKPMSIPVPYSLTDSKTGETKEFEDLYYYHIPVKSTVTALPGTCRVTIVITGVAKGSEADAETAIGKSYAAPFTVEYASIATYDVPTSPTDDDFEQLVQLLLTYQGTLTAHIKALDTLKQDKTDEGLETTEKTVVGAINELRDTIEGDGEEPGISGRLENVERKVAAPLVTDFSVRESEGELSYNDGSKKTVYLPGGISAARPWVRYSPNATGSPMYETPQPGCDFIGVAVGLNPSTDPADYVWSQFVGKGFSSVALSGFSFVFTYDDGSTETVPIDTEQAIIVRETDPTLVTSFNGETGDVVGVSSLNGKTGKLEAVESINGKTGTVTLDTVDNAKKVELANGVFADIETAILEIAYPVGSVKESSDEIDYSTYLGGVWVPYGDTTQGFKWKRMA